MPPRRYCVFLILIYSCTVYSARQTDVNFRIEAGTRTCFFEPGKVGQLLETQYQVIDGQHGDLDISFDITDPKGTKIVSDYKKSENALMLDLHLDGDYEFCLDNTYSRMNSKLVYVYVFIEEELAETEAEVHVVDGENNEEHILEWMGINEAGEPYYLQVSDIADSMTRTLKHVIKARHMMDLYTASKTRDSYLAFEATFVVDAWSSIQISCMVIVGLIQVFMIKKLFNKPYHKLPSYH